MDEAQGFEVLHARSYLRGHVDQTSQTGGWMDMKSGGGERERLILEFLRVRPYPRPASDYDWIPQHSTSYYVENST